MKTWILALLLCVFSFSVAADPVITKHIYATNSMNMEPVESLEVTSFQNERLYIFWYWDDIESEVTYEVTGEIYDAMNKKVRSFKGVLYSIDSRDRTIYRYNFKPEKDFPGDWRIKLYLDGQLKFNKMIYVSE